MITTKQNRLQVLEVELSIIRSLYESFWSEMSIQQQDYLANMEHEVVKEIRILKHQLTD